MIKKGIFNNFKAYATIQNYQDYLSLIKSRQVISYSQDPLFEFYYVFLPNFLFLRDFTLHVKDISFMSSGSQNASFFPKGAYTGEVVMEDLLELGASYVLIGHSEQRNYLKETLLNMQKKIKKALELNINPIVCMGEKEAMSFIDFKTWIKDELASLFSFDIIDDLKKSSSKIIIAYEPSWAIGKSEAAEIESIRKNILFIKEFFKAEGFKDSPDILYGGSVNEKNISLILSQKEIDGVLLGRSCINPISWLKMIRNISFYKDEHA